ncbi:MAG: hypothetical protein ACYDH6_03630 [Acidimicrobiales bacterium]
MSTTSAELASMATTAEELVLRLGPIAEAYRRDQRDDVVSEIHEAERALGSAVRRLQRVASLV